MSYAGAPPPPPGPPGPGGASTRRRLSPGLLAFLIVDVVLVIAVVIAAIVILGDGDSEPTASPTTTSSAPVSPDATTSAPEPSEPTTTEPGTETTSPDEGPTDEPTLFASPSGNITCAISAEGARCGIAQLASKPASIDTCDGSVGYVYIVTEAGVEVPCVAKGDRPKTAEGGTSVLDYGKEATGFGFTCESAEDGVTCRNDASGRGFQLARAGGQVF